MTYKIKIFQETKELPPEWNKIVTVKNILLSREYLLVLEVSKPQNMICFFGAFFLEEELIGGCLFQILDFHKHNSLLKTSPQFYLKTFFSKLLVKDVLICGNNMLTGQNAFYFNDEKISKSEIQTLLLQALNEVQKLKEKTSLTIFKDFDQSEIKTFLNSIFQSYFRFSVQPNMVLELKDYWKNFEDYKNDLTKKYRGRLNAARNKMGSVEKKELSLSLMRSLSSELNKLYETVAKKASINTFFLPQNHFEKMKENLGRNFRIFGYFLHGRLIGFYTLIINGNTIDTYFLGYDGNLQKEKQLYLNMLLDMVEFGITEKFSTIIFGRTALEIKSTIGAEPVEIFGLIKHRNYFINKLMSEIFPAVEPKTVWIQRKPFR